MDNIIRAYQRKLAAGDGSWQDLLHLGARAGLGPGDLVGDLISPELREQDKEIVRMHLNHKSSADFRGVGRNSLLAAMEAVKILFEIELAKKCLIVAPTGIVNYLSEQITDHLKQSPMIVTRKNLHHLSSLSKVYLVSYSSLCAVHRLTNGAALPGGLTGQLCFGDTLLNRDWDVIAALEAHLIKNRNAKRSQFCYALSDKIPRKIAITACPVPNHITDIWGIFRFINPDILGKSYRQFALKFFPCQTPRFPYGSWGDLEIAQQRIIQCIKSVPGICWDNQDS